MSLRPVLEVGFAGANTKLRETGFRPHGPINWPCKWADGWEVQFVATQLSVKKWLDANAAAKTFFFDCEFVGITLGLVQLGVYDRNGGHILLVDMTQDVLTILPIQELFWNPEIAKVGFAIQNDIRCLLHQSHVAHMAKQLLLRSRGEYDDDRKKKWWKGKKKVDGNWKRELGLVDLQKGLFVSVVGESLAALQRLYLRADVKVYSAIGPHKSIFKLTEYASLLKTLTADEIKRLNQIKGKCQVSPEWIKQDARLSSTAVTYAATDVILVYYLAQLINSSTFSF